MMARPATQPERLPPTRFLPRLMEQMRFVVNDPRARVQYAADMLAVYAHALELLEDSYTKRILFSARQAGLFDGIGLPPDEIQRNLRLPFEQFYLELDDDLTLARPFNDGDMLALRALFVQQIPAPVPEGHAGHTLLSVAFFYRSARVARIHPAGMVDAEWLMCLTCGRGYLPAEIVREEPTTGLTLPPGLPYDALIAAPEDAQDGALYYTAQGTALLGYLLAYLSAKSITVQAEPVPRQERRWLERHGKTPQPWHIVKLEPRVNTQPPPEAEPSVHHSFRYDVIGHLRFNRHRLADGSYRHTVEWVPAHQRGLDHVDYIPKTYRVQAGKEVHPIMRDYWGIGQRAAP